jgi:ubiquinone/menaquinone biosynthesis C-methylase UbiE
LLYQHLHKILTLIYDLLYHSFAWSYDLVAAVVSFGRWNTWVREIIPLIRGENLLELGFGPGHLLVEAAGRGMHIFGIDESLQMTRQALKRISKKIFQANLVRGVSQHLPFPSLFDTVIATFPSEYIFDPLTMAEIQRVLAPGGRMIVLLTAIPGETSKLNQFLNWVTNSAYKKGLSKMEEKLDKVIQRYQSNGFHIEKVVLSRRSVSLLILVGEKSRLPG